MSVPLLTASYVRRGVLSLLLLVVCALAGGAPGQRAQADHPPRPRDKFIGYTVELAVEREGEVKMLSISMVVAGDGTPDAGQSIEEAEELLLTRFPGARIVEESGVAAQRVIKSYSWTAGYARFSYHREHRPAGMTGDIAAVLAAADTWSSSGAAFTFIFDGLTDNDTGACRSDSELDGENTVGWASDLPPHILGIACSWYSINGAIEFDVEFNTQFNWTTSLDRVEIDLQTIAGHELGHTLGLGNTQPDYCPEFDPNSRALMCGYYQPGTVIHELTADELAGLLDLYGPLVGPPPRPATPFQVVIPAIARN